MVKTFIFLMFISLNLMAQNVTVTSEMNYTQLFEGIPLTGTITITHDKDLKIDLNSFKIGQKPLTVKFLKDVAMSTTSPLIISFYSFEIPSMPKGLHVLPQISVKVADKVYKSYSTSFEVFANQGNQQQTVSPASPQPSLPNQNTPPIVSENSDANHAVLLIEVKVDGPTTLYPGQQTKFIYKFLYKGHIELTKEVLPLLDAEGLKKIGDKQTKDYEENNLNVSEFSQIFAGDNPGVFVFGPSIIEGTSYEENAKGQKFYASKPLHSEVAPITIQVLPFPATGKPASFNGSIGNYTFKASLNSSSELIPGEKIVLLLEMKGDPTFLSTVQAPDLCCQPGFSGIFKPSDLPPISSIVGNTKQFLVDLRPLSSTIKEVPSIEFSSFDPTSGKYLTAKSSPIPLFIKKSSGQEKSSAKEGDEIPLDETIKDNSPIEISGIYKLVPSDLHDKFLGTFWNLLFSAVFVGLLLTQINFKKEIAEKKPDSKELPSIDLLKSALNQEPGSADFYRLIQKTLIKALNEKGIISTTDIEPENLEKTDLQGDVRIFLTKLDEIRFSGTKKFNQAIISSAKELYNKIMGTTTS